MKVLKTIEEAREYMFDFLSKKDRWNSMYDETLFEETINNVSFIALAKGIAFKDCETINNFKVLYLYNPFVVMAYGSSVAFCAYVQDPLQLVIFVDDDFMHMSDSTKEFIIKHELGHFLNGHKYTGTRNIKQEIEADAYAVSKTSKRTGIKALKELKKVLGNLFDDYKPRLRAIKYKSILRGNNHVD